MRNKWWWVVSQIKWKINQPYYVTLLKWDVLKFANNKGLNIYPRLIDFQNLEQVELFSHLALSMAY